MAALEWVVPCRQHGRRGQLVYCYAQLDGDHISLRKCTCGDAITASCPIDYHRHLYTQRHPMFALAEKRKRAQSVTSQRENIKHDTHR